MKWNINKGDRAEGKENRKLRENEQSEIYTYRERGRGMGREGVE